MQKKFRNSKRLFYISDFDCSFFASTFDGVRFITINSVIVSVKCSLGGWTVIQSRGQFGYPNDFFNTQTWANYVNGFGISGKLFVIQFSSVSLY